MARVECEVRDAVEVKLLPRDDEVYMLARSRARVLKERSMRRRRLGELRKQAPPHDELLMKLGAAQEGRTRLAPPGRLGAKPPRPSAWPRT